jgi:hypothetical protein
MAGKRRSKICVQKMPGAGDERCSLTIAWERVEWRFERQCFIPSFWSEARISAVEVPATPDARINVVICLTSSTFELRHIKPCQPEVCIFDIYIV